MISVDEIVKLILAISVGFSLLMISFQLARVLSKAADAIQDLRRGLQNFSKASDMVLEDYLQIRKLINLVTGLKSSLWEPLKVLMRILNKEEEESTKQEEKDIRE